MEDDLEGIGPFESSDSTFSDLTKYVRNKCKHSPHVLLSSSLSTVVGELP